MKCNEDKIKNNLNIVKRNGKAVFGQWPKSIHGST